MHSPALAITVIACAAPVLGDPNTNIREYGDVDKNALKGCLDSYRTGNWAGMDCGGRGWFKGHLTTYNSARECYDACSPGIRSAIEQGASDVQCLDTAGLTWCWMGYH